MFSAYCPHCKSDGLAVAPMTKGELPQSAAHLAQPKIRRVPAGATTDDVADMHTFLKDFRGDFCSLFSKD